MGNQRQGRQNPSGLLDQQGKLEEAEPHAAVGCIQCHTQQACLRQLLPELAVEALLGEFVVAGQ